MPSGADPKEKALPLVLANYSMVCSLGHDAKTACAAARAGLSRARPAALKVQARDTGEAEAPLVHEVDLVTHGFEGEARLVQLLQVALRNMAVQMRADGAAPRSAACYLSVPAPYRTESGYELIADEDVRSKRTAALAEVRKARKEQGREDAPAAYVARIFDRAKQIAGWQLELPLRHVDVGGEVGLAASILAASADLAQGRCDVALIAAIDSLVGEQELNWLHAMGRLKSSDYPCGLQPGEAAVVLAFRRSAQPQDRSKPRVVVTEARVASEPSGVLTGKPPLGTCIAELVLASRAAEDTLWILSDHNGESYRAAELGGALVKLTAGGATNDIQFWYPATSFGDTGSASAAMALCLAARAIERNYAPATAGCIVSGSLSGERSVIRFAAT